MRVKSLKVFIYFNQKKTLKHARMIIRILSEIRINKFIVFNCENVSTIAGLNLDYVTSNPWVVMMVSALRGDKIPDVVDWLVKKSKK